MNNELQQPIFEEDDVYAGGSTSSADPPPTPTISETVEVDDPETATMTTKAAEAPACDHLTVPHSLLKAATSGSSKRRSL